jgi:hypothetical protein
LNIAKGVFDNETKKYKSNAVSRDERQERNYKECSKVDRIKNEDTRNELKILLGHALK